MAVPRMAGFISEVVGQVNRQLDTADSWAALKAEYLTMQARGINITDPDVAYLGIDAAKFIQIITAQQAVADYIHQPAQANLLYALKQ